MIVADTNLVAYLLIEGDRTEAARRVWARDPAWHVPPLWRSEYLSVLTVSVRALVLERDAALLAWNRAVGLLGDYEVEPTGEDVLATAVDLGVSAYDAHFVCVARELRAPLVTSDRRLIEACPRVAVSPEAFMAA